MTDPTRGRRRAGRRRDAVPQMRDTSVPQARVGRISPDMPKTSHRPRRHTGLGRRGRRLAAAAGVLAVLLVCVVVVLLVPPVRDAVLAPFAEPAVEASADDEGETGVVMDEESEPVPMSEAAAFYETTDDGLEVLAPEAFLAGDELAAVQEALDVLEADGSNVAFVMQDLASGRGIRYNDEMRFYSASSIKVAVCTMIFEEYGGGAGYSGTIADTLIWSSNDDFTWLVNNFGFENVSAWLAAHGAPNASIDAAQHLYVDISATEMANVWQEIWRYGTSGEAGSDELTGYLAQTDHSPIGETLRERCVVWSKPGWYPDDGYDLSASNDAGIVFAEEGDYVLVILSDIGDNTDALIPLVEALDAAHASMCGDELVEP